MEIEKVTETATYTCTASNGAGTDTKEAKVAMKSESLGHTFDFIYFLFVHFLQV